MASSKRMTQRSHRSRTLVYLWCAVVVSVGPLRVDGGVAGREKDHKHVSGAHGLKERLEEYGFSQAEENHHYRNGVHNAEFDHEMILGSHDLVEEYEGYTTEESKKKLEEEIIPQIDTNSDGIVDKVELSNWIFRSFTRLSEEESKERFEEADSDSDGLVSIEEHIAEDYGIESDKDWPDKDDDDYEETLKWVEEDKKTFAAADTDGDGRLDRHEYYRFVYPEEHEDMFQHVIASTLEDKDVNRDGKIDFTEFLGGETGLKHSQRALFEEHDKDKSGFLDSEAEFRSWMIPDTRAMANEEVDHLLGFADDDKDGSLSAAEMLAHWDAFVPSKELSEHDEL